MPSGRIGVQELDLGSPSDRFSRTVQRVTQFLHMGVKQVWVVDPQAHDVSVYRAGRDPEMLGADSELNAADIQIGRAHV